MDPALADLLRKLNSKVEHLEGELAKESAVARRSTSASAELLTELRSMRDILVASHAKQAAGPRAGAESSTIIEVCVQVLFAGSACTDGVPPGRTCARSYVRRRMRTQHS
jgi:hypothetical protein